MKEPILVIMAAGMGSRYGGLKQLDSVGPRGEVMLDYSLYDAKEAGFKKVIFIIKPDMAERFKAQVGDRVAQYMTVEYAYQKLEDLPAGFAVPTSRTKPWGTGMPSNQSMIIWLKCRPIVIHVIVWWAIHSRKRSRLTGRFRGAFAKLMSQVT